MYLETDDQTIEDLRIFSRRDTPGIYDLYNHTHTRGGEMKLQEMFRKPLGDRELINKRSSLIAQLATLDLAFPFSGSLFDTAEKYLVDSKEVHRAGQTHLSEKEIGNGVSAVIEMVQGLRAFIQRQELVAIRSFDDERMAIGKLLDDPALTPILQEKDPARISFAAATAYDILLRVREKQKIEKLLDHIYTLDVFLSVAKVAAGRQFVFPEAMEKGTGVLNLQGVYHPELKSPVANNLNLHSEDALLFLTGANMAGKSTFLRSVGTAVYIAHMGFPVAAKQLQFSVLDGMFTTINLPDNLGIGASHFYAEVLRVKQVAAALKQRKSIFVIFDELFRGTNVKDAHEATVAIALAFAEKMNSKFIISSHIVEAAEELSQHPAIRFQYLPTRMNGSLPEYTYTLEKGVTNDRHGMIIIQNEGILDILRNGRKAAIHSISPNHKTGNKHELQH